MKYIGWKNLILEDTMDDKTINSVKRYINHLDREALQQVIISLLWDKKYVINQAEEFNKMYGALEWRKQILNYVFLVVAGC